MIDLTLDSLLVPALEGYSPVVGKKIEYTPLNKGGLSTQQVAENIALPFVKQRSLVIDKSDLSSVIEYDASIMISGEDVTLTLDRGVAPGIEIQIICLKSAQIRYAGISKNSDDLPNTLTDKLNAFTTVSYIWTGTAWFCTSAPGLGSVKKQLPGTPKPSSIYGGQWTEMKLGGAFLRAEGGDAKPFTDPMTVTSVSGNAITVDALVTAIAVGDLVIADDEYRTITAINGTTITVDSAFTRSDLRVVILGQADTLQNHTHNTRGANEHASGSTGYFSVNGGGTGAGWKNFSSEPQSVNSPVRISSETRSKNITVRYWKRVA